MEIAAKNIKSAVVNNLDRYIFSLHGSQYKKWQLGTIQFFCWFLLFQQHGSI
jgi:hypothetical protein